MKTSSARVGTEWVPGAPRRMRKWDDAPSPEPFHFGPRGLLPYVVVRGELCYSEAIIQAICYAPQLRPLFWSGEE